ncbi:hypothetical protein [Corynebacterium uterequi]|uniref:EcsC protein family n=1 Tax=Corynebacterium uterequi TaxID=1072256 RepID=A0A0G3HDR0_9CORY|nr:hypothetical protein [Corynebacterium uterequi]AKK10845.1 hypothetical protein CUTER_04195 [Corynebacterium uterequi]
MTTNQSEDLATNLGAELSSDMKKLDDNLGTVGRTFINALDRAIELQTSTIESYLTALRRRHPEDAPADIQARLDKHFTRLSSGSGASVGAASALPGIGFVTGSAAVAGESLVFLDGAAFYTVASAALRGVDVRDPERRRALVLLALLGSEGNALVEALVGDLASQSAKGTTASLRALGKLSGPTLAPINNRLTKLVLKRVTKRFMTGWIGKLMPLGIGAIAGAVVNRRLAKGIISNVRDAMGATPATFATALPPQEEKKSEEEGRSAVERVKSAATALSTRLGDLIPRLGFKKKDEEPSEDEELDALAIEAMKH